MEILVVGAGIGGLTLALSLERLGLACRVYEAAPEIRPLGVGINLLPHSTRELTELGLQERLARVAVETREVVFCNRFGQFIFREPRGRHAGYDWPQFSIHRGDLQAVLLEAARERGIEILPGMKCIAVRQDENEVEIRFENGAWARGAAAIGCDGIHSAVRKILYPDEGPPAYQGIHMWRGVTRMKPWLTGASMVIGGWLEVGKMVAYPIRDDIDGKGTQLVNWVAEIQSPRNVVQDWNLAGRLEDFYPAFADWRFDWLDVAALVRGADMVLEYPMVDRDPLPAWSRGRVTLLGDAAHPMVPRGSNGAGQAILDAVALAECLAQREDTVEALKQYEARRLEATANIVRMNRKNPPDAILREVYLRTGDKPFKDIDEVISREELAALTKGYAKVAGYDQDTLRTTRSA